MATTITVNGKRHDIQLPESTPLLYILRNDLGLKGTRFGCGTGHCGACHVLLDGNTVPACDTPLWSVAGRAVTTIEGLANDGAPHPLQQAFLDEQAAQCGYCASGVIMTAVGVLAKDPSPSNDALRSALDRNLCRCGAHTRMLKAIERAARVMRHG